MISAIALLLSALIAPSIYDAAKTEAWRAQREKDLRSDTGWLTIVGLTFLERDRSSVGADPSSDVVLPAGAPNMVGVVVRKGASVSFEPADGVELTLNGSPLTRRVSLLPRDLVSAGTVSFRLHRSGGRLAVRIVDTNSELRRTFAGVRWFPIRSSWSVRGRFAAYPSAKTIRVPNILGDLEELTIPGEAVFIVGGKEVRLQAARSGRQLWFIFSDLLAGDETYQVRFLYAEPPDADGRVTLDFNRAYNPPCAYNPFTTCPLPPPGNRLGIRIDAGERAYKAAAAGSVSACDLPPGILMRLVQAQRQPPTRTPHPHPPSPIPTQLT